MKQFIIPGDCITANPDLPPGICGVYDQIDLAIEHIKNTLITVTSHLDGSDRCLVALDVLSVTLAGVETHLNVIQALVWHAAETTTPNAEVSEVAK